MHSKANEYLNKLFLSRNYDKKKNTNEFICELDSWPCEIISGDVNGARRGEFLLLVQLGVRVDDTCSYHLLQYFQGTFNISLNVI